MIVNKLNNRGWEIIFQRHHGLLAARLFSELKFFHLPQSIDRTAMMTAIAEHDDGQRDWQEGEFVNDQGEPIDFTQYDYDLKHARKAVIEASYKSSYITLIISRHVTELYSNVPNATEELKDYLSEQKDHQKQLLSSLNISSNEFDRQYQLLRWCDELSLALCQDQPAYELPSLQANGAKYQLIKENAFYLRDWPFQANQLTIPLETYQLSKSRFDNNQDLFNHLKQTSRTVRKVVLMKR